MWITYVAILSAIGNLYMVTLARLCNVLRPPFRASKESQQLQISLLGLVVCALVLSGCTSKVGSVSSSSPAVTGTLTASTQSVTFGSVPVGQSASTNITVTNDGSAPVIVSQVAVS